jgi:hypothetical protein
MSRLTGGVDCGLEKWAHDRASVAPGKKNGRRNKFSPHVNGLSATGYFFFAAFLAGFLAAAFFFAGAFLAGAFLAGAFFLAGIDNPPFRSAVAVDEKFFDQH